MPEPSSHPNQINKNSVRAADGCDRVLAPVPAAVVAGAAAEGPVQGGRVHVGSEDVSKECKSNPSNPMTTSSLRKHQRKSNNTVKIDRLSSPCDCCSVATNEDDFVDIGQEQLSEVAFENYWRWYGLPVRSAGLAQIRGASTGLLG